MKSSKIFILVLLTFFLSSQVFAETTTVSNNSNYYGSAVKKLGRGIFDVVESPFQIPKEMIDTGSNTKHPSLASLKGGTVGLGKGILSMGGQIVNGVVEILTFPIPHPNKPIFNISIFPQE